MNARNRYACFLCNHEFLLNNLRRIDRDDDVDKKNLAVLKREVLELPVVEVTQLTRLCINCLKEITEEINDINDDSTVPVKLNTLRQTPSHACFICNEDGGDLCRLTLKCRVKIFIAHDIY